MSSCFLESSAESEEQLHNHRTFGESSPGARIWSDHLLWAQPLAVIKVSSMPSAVPQMPNTSKGENPLRSFGGDGDGGDRGAWI